MRPNHDSRRKDCPCVWCTAPKPPVPDVPIALSPEEWGMVIAVLSDRRRARYDHIIAKIQGGLS